MIRVLSSLLLALSLAGSATFAQDDVLPGTLLQLPPGLVQVLPVNEKLSYLGDAVRIVDCADDRDQPLGTCGNLLFGGLALTASPVRGLVQIRFFPPVDNISHFEVTFPGNLSGDDGVLKAPQFYELPVSENFVFDPFFEVSSGDLNLLTGEVTNFTFQAVFLNSFYQALQLVNPNLRGAAFAFPGPVGTAQGRFEQRSDGLLDFTLDASTFLPLGKDILGDPVRFPLPFCGPLLQCGSVEARGTSLHPFIRLTTKEGAGDEVACEEDCPDLPSNRVQEYTAFSHSTSFGDHFRLNIPQLGGNATLRSHLQGRFQIQFGERFGDDLVPFAVSSLPPAGLIGEPPAEAPFPGISLGLIGHDDIVHFPLETYEFREHFFADDPFDLVVGVVDAKTGAVIGDLQYRGFFNQTVFEALIRMNPGIPLASQRFLGPARFERGTNNQTIFRYRGEEVVRLPGVIFPRPDLVTGWVAGPDSAFDIFLNFQAMHPVDAPVGVKTGSESDVLSSTGDRFSYSYSIPCDPAAGGASFEYTNTTGGGTFRMQSLASVRCLNSRGSTSAPGDSDTVTFTGFGSWSADDQPHVATVQISTSPEFPYVSIMIDGGLVSNVDTRPAEEPIP